MELKERIKKKIEEIKPRLEELACGHVEFIDLDEKEGSLKVKLIGGRLH